jgi:O-antigen/teichoic acid export membrane protein
VALTESQNPDRPARMTMAALPAQVRAKVHSWLADGSDRSLAQKVAGGAFLIRVFSAGLIYLSQILLARWMGSFEFGIYVYVWTLVLMIGDLADLGLATAAQRFIPEYTRRKANDLLRGYLSRSRWIAVGSAALVAAAGVLLIQALKPYMADYLVLPLSVALVTLPFYAILQIQDGIARSYNWIHVALLPPYVIRHAVMLVLVCAAWLLSFPANAETAVLAVGIALTVTAVGQTLVLNRKLSQTVDAGPKAYDTRTWLAVSLPILFVEGFYVLLTNVDILILQQFRSPDDVAVYYAAAKTLALISFVHFAVSAAVAHRFSEYHTTNDRTRLEAILADSIKWVFWGSLVACLGILAAGHMLLWLFGPKFVAGYHLMLILAVGLLARAALGPVERLLSMLGEQRICATIYAVAFAINIVLCIVLIPWIGIEGAAISTTTALVVESILLFTITRRRLGFHVFILGRGKRA